MGKGSGWQAVMTEVKVQGKVELSIRGASYGLVLIMPGIQHIMDPIASGDIRTAGAATTPSYQQP